MLCAWSILEKYNFLKIYLITIRAPVDIDTALILINSKFINL